MKKRYRTYLAVQLVLILMMTMIGCGGQEGETNSVQTTAANEQNETVAEETGSVEDPESDTGSEVITEKEGTVYMLVGDAKVPRYPTYDFPAVKEALAKYAPNVEFEMLDAEASLQKQLQQAETIATTGADAAIVIAVETNNMGGILTTLHDAGIMTMTIARDSRGGPLDYHVTMPFPVIAETNAEYVENYMRENPKDTPYRIAFIGAAPGAAYYEELRATYTPIFERWEEEGLAEIVWDVDSNSWNESGTQPVVEQCLTALENQLDVMIVMGDSPATGAAAALSAQGLAGKVLLAGGCDGNLEGVARVQAGWQALDMMPDYAMMGETAAKIIAMHIAGEEIDESMFTGRFDNGYVEGGVPMVQIPPILITKDTIKEVVVDRGYYTQEEIDEVAAGMK